MPMQKAMLVTGAGRGIGRATALHLAAAGARVAVNDLDRALADAVVAEIGAAGGAAIAVPGSVADWDAAARMVEDAVAQFGRLAGLVNNAGLHYQAMPWEEDPARVRALIEVNVLGSLYCAIHAVTAFRAQGSGAIVNIASAGALGAPQRAVYGASKGAILSYTVNLARDLAPHGIRVNALAPLAATRMTDPALAGVGEGGSDHGARAGEFAAMPDPGQIAPAIAWLLSDAAASVTGRVVRFNGRRLSLIEPPALSDIFYEQESWTAVEIGAAIERLTK
ncbi:SDR family oxidoreductase [soil metagenome]